MNKTQKLPYLTIEAGTFRERPIGNGPVDTLAELSQSVNPRAHGAHRDLNSSLVRRATRNRAEYIESTCIGEIACGSEENLLPNLGIKRSTAWLRRIHVDGPASITLDDGNLARCLNSKGKQKSTVYRGAGQFGITRGVRLDIHSWGSLCRSDKHALR